MSKLVNLLFRTWFYPLIVTIAILLLDPVAIRSTTLFLATLVYMGVLWIVFVAGKVRLYEAKPKVTAIMYSLYMPTPILLYISGSYGSAFAVSYLLILAGLVFPVPGIDVYKYITEDA